MCMLKQTQANIKWYSPYIIMLFHENQIFTSNIVE